MQPRPRAVPRRAEVVPLPRRSMSQKEYDRRIRDLAMVTFGFLLGVLSVAWWEVG